MKYKERRGNVFVFDGGYGSGEMELKFIAKTDIGTLCYFGGIMISSNFDIDCSVMMKYKDIQTAVNLKDEGLV